MKLNYVKRPAGLNYRLFQHAVRRIAGSFDTYHPAWLQQKLQPGQRDCSDRWNLIERQIARHNATSLLDLGCAEGYFVRRAAEECKCLALGVDADFARILVAQNTALLDGVQGAAFAYADIDCAFMDKMPHFDVVIFLSVLHHVMYEHGVDYSRDLLRTIRRKTGIFMIFDMGQSNERLNQWAALLPDMGDDPAVWIADFLASAGFTGIERLGTTDSYQNEARRTVFLAKP